MSQALAGDSVVELISRRHLAGRVASLGAAVAGRVLLADDLGLQPAGGQGTLFGVDGTLGLVDTGTGLRAAVVEAGPICICTLAQLDMGIVHLQRLTYLALPTGRSH